MSTSDKLECFIAELNADILQEAICEIDLIHCIIPKPNYTRKNKIEYRSLAKRLREYDYEQVDVYINESGDNNMYIQYKKLSEDIGIISDIYNKTVTELRENCTYKFLAEAFADLKHMKNDVKKFNHRIKMQAVVLTKLMEKLYSINRAIHCIEYETKRNMHRYESRVIYEEAYINEKIHYARKYLNANIELLKIYYKQKSQKLINKIASLQFQYTDEEDINKCVKRSLRHTRDNYKSEMKMWSKSIHIDREDWENEIYRAKVFNERQKLYIEELQQKILCRLDQHEEYLKEKLQEFPKKVEDEEIVEEESLSLISRQNTKMKMKKKRKQKSKRNKKDDKDENVKTKKKQAMKVK